MTDLRARRATADGPPAAPAQDVVPGPRPPADPPDTDRALPSGEDAPPGEPGGVELGRLLAMARLTPAQAVELGSGLLAAAAAHAGPGAGPDSTGGARLRVDDVLVGADGRVVLRAAGRVAPGAVGAVLTDVARAARLRSRPPDPADEGLLGELDRAVAELPAGMPVAARTLGQALAGDRGQVRAELAALARALRGDAVPPRVPGPGGAPSGPVGPAVPARQATRGSRHVRRRIGAWLLSVLVLGGVVLLEFALLKDKVAGDVGTLLSAGRSGVTTSAAPKPDGLPMPSVAPAAAGGVRGVDLRTLTGCGPGAPCGVRVLVRVAPAAAPRVVSWSYRVIDRCTGSATTAPGGSVPVPAGQDRAAVVGTVPLPAVRGVGVIAVTTAPATAASSPVLVGSCRSGTG